MTPSRVKLLFFVLIAAVSTGLGPLQVGVGAASNRQKELVFAQASSNEPPVKTPEEKMKARFPQPAKVGDLIGLPLLDKDDKTIGFVQHIAKTSNGKVEIVTLYGRWFGWLRYPGFVDGFRRPVAIPIEAVVILGRQINVLEMDRMQIDSAPTWSAQKGSPLATNELIKIGLGRR
jgi:hypothetical protein